MKQNIHSVALLLILVFLLISTSHTSSRKLASKQEIKSNHKSVTEMEDADSFPNLMGMEECENGDEECLNRRVLADAHLDYIYTQHHKP